MNVCVIGLGYVGLTAAACFAEMGNFVTCVDRDDARIADLDRGRLPIFEQGLAPLISRNHADGRLRFATSFDAAADPAVVFIAVGTPPAPDGSIDVDEVLAAARSVGRRLAAYAVVVCKSTVPVGTSERVRATVQEELDRRKAAVEFDVASNPEFLKEGAAVNDFMRPDRVVIGSGSARALAVLRELYAPFLRNHDRILVMTARDAEMTKYVANAMLATRISFMNEIADLCERLGVDVENVRKGMGSDSRIGYSFLYPGCGFGGSCLPKDVRALVRAGGEAGAPLEILERVERRNAMQKRRLFDKIVQRFGSALPGHAFGVWGLAFKPGTDDIREAPAATVVGLLIEAGARVHAYDPAAAEAFGRSCPADWIERGALRLAANQYDALDGASALVLITEWKQFRNPDFARIRRLLKTPAIFDGRNQYDRDVLAGHGLEYFGIGR